MTKLRRKNMKIAFKNLDRSIVSLSETGEERALRERIETEFSDRAAEIGAEFQAKAVESLASCNPAYAGTGIDALMRNIPRFAYIKCDTYDIQIDLLLHSFLRCEHI
jgi:hypothetical protein